MRNEQQCANQEIGVPRIVRPAQKVATKRPGLVELFFKRESAAPDGKYWVAGGIFWPELTRIYDHDAGADAQQYLGSAVLCGKHIESECVYVFEETEFSSIDHVLGPNGGVEYEGFSSFLNSGWGHYFCQTYYWRQDPTVAARYIRMVHMSAMIQPKPLMVELMWRDDNAALGEIFMLDTGGRLCYRNGLFYKAMLEYKADPERLHPVLRALTAALMGLAKKPVK